MYCLLDIGTGVFRSEASEWHIGSHQQSVKPSGGLLGPSYPLDGEEERGALWAKLTRITCYAKYIGRMLAGCIETKRLSGGHNNAIADI